MGYHIAQLLVDAIGKADTLDGDAVVKAIGETDMMTIYHRVVFAKTILANTRSLLASG